MGRECAFILPGGRKCRCAATRNQSVCRHHAPKPAVPAPPPLPKSERYSNLIRWRRVGSSLAWMDPTEMTLTVYDILDCLIDRGPNSNSHISDLTAGRFLRVLLNRLGQVPFPNPEFASPGPALQHDPKPAPNLPVPDLDDQAALLAAFAKQGLISPELLRGMSSPPSHAPLNQSRSRVNQ